MTQSAENMQTHRLTAFDVGQVKAHMEHGLSANAIAKRVFRMDGKTPFGETAIQNCMNHLQADPKWRGERAEGSGAPRKTSKSQDKKVVQFVLRRRGKQRVTVAAIKKKFRFLRKVSDSLVEERLHDAELKWLRRRRKSIVTKKYLEPRIEYCKGVKRKHSTTLEQWAYTDGTVFYLDRDEDEHQHSKRRALGTHVWRKTDRKDALYQDCIGPGSYSKGQGVPVKVWGLLACGVLHIHVLEQGENMDKHLYAELVEEKFESWCGNCEWLVCDHEACLRTEEALLALDFANLKLVDFPKCSQDVNAIENAWGMLKDRLYETMPDTLETRAAFIKRLHAAVKWINKHKGERLWYLSTNQKERADECLGQTPPGGRTSW